MVFEEDATEITKIVTRDESKLLKDRDPFMAHKPDEISSYVLKNCLETLKRPSTDITR